MGLLRAHLGTTAVRELEIKLADSPLYQWFCFIDNFGGVKAPAKSSIDRYKNLFPEPVLEQVFQHLLRQAAEEPEHLDPDLEILVNSPVFEMPTNLLEVWYDSTCLAPNIHFPVDWVQLADASRTLLKAIRVIRKHGLKNRLPKDPESFLSEQNHITPKSPVRLQEKLADPAFAASQKRRSQTEARIAIVTNDYQPGRSRSKGLASRRQELRWIMLAHNLRILARKRLREQGRRKALQEQARKARKEPPGKAA